MTFFTSAFLCGLYIYLQKYLDQVFTTLTPNRNIKMSSTSPQPSSSANEPGAVVSSTQDDLAGGMPLITTDASPAPTTSNGEEEPSLESLQSELDQSMTLVPYVLPESTSNGAHADGQGHVLPATGGVINVPLAELFGDAPFFSYGFANATSADLPTLDNLNTHQALVVPATTSSHPLPTLTSSFAQVHHHHHHQHQHLHHYLHQPVQLALSDLFADQQTEEQYEQEMANSEAMFGPIRHQTRTTRVEVATAFVETLDEVDITSIEPEDMKCPLCWLPFGSTTDEEGPTIATYLDHEEREITERLHASYALPFCENRPDNDPVRTPCGHVFGRQCLIDSLETNMICPMCRCRVNGNEGVTRPYHSIFGNILL